MRTDFVPAAFDATRWPTIEPLVRALLERPVASSGELERWLLDRSEFDAACSEAKADLYIAMTCRTDDDSAQRAYTSYVETVPPRLTPAAFELDKRQSALAARFPLPPARYGVLDRATRANVEIFREENVPLETRLTLLAQKYDQTIGAMTVLFDGEEQPLPRMARYQETPDRSIREAAWRAVGERRLRDGAEIAAIYDEMIALRQRIAVHAGFENYMGYAFKSMHRFDYTPDHCVEFHEGVAKTIVPLVHAIEERRRRSLRVDPLRPWDLAVDTLGRPPLRPFEGGGELLHKTRAAFDRLDPRLGRMVGELAKPSGGRASLDLDSRRGKAPGGYQYMRDRARTPFIFMNAAGLARDVVTMVHEAGHAFHSMLCVDEPLLAYRHSPIEFAEVASMSMELLILPHLLGSFYDRAEDHARHGRQQIERSVSILPWIATIDAFQHWVYANPKHTREEREARWLALDGRFGSAVSWEGLEQHRRHLWQRQQHLFSVPFYYIEYGIAQLGALQLWVHSLEHGEASAIDRYTRALSLGGSRPLPDLFEAAGLRFEFGPEALARVAERIARELEQLPD